MNCASDVKWKTSCFLLCRILRYVWGRGRDKYRDRDWGRQEYEREVCVEVRGCGTQVTWHRRRDYLVLRRKETNMRREGDDNGGGK